MKNCFQKITDEKYFAAEGLSNSFLKDFDRGPAYAFMKRKKTKAIKDGFDLHAYILTPEEFEKNYIVAPEEYNDRRLKPYKEWSKDQTSNILLYKEYKNFKIISNKIFKYKLTDELTFKNILDVSEKELALFWEQYEIQRKGKMDLFAEYDEYNIIIDLKKTVDCSEFIKQVRTLKYYRQAATYVDGAEILTNKKTYFYFMCFENVYPYGVKAFKMSDEYIGVGRVANLKSIEKYKEWDGNIEKCYDEGVEELFPPDYLLNN